MGFSSFNCNSCGHPLLSCYATNSVNRWMEDVVVIVSPGAELISGVYDGYARIGGQFVAEDGPPCSWHYACWKAEGKPTKFTKASEWSDDQGYFFDQRIGGDHDMEEPLAQKER